MFKKTLTATAVIFLGLAFMQPSAVYAACDNPAACAQQGTEDVSNGGEGLTLQEGIKTIVNVLLFLIGAIAIIMLIIGGIRYTTSNGDSAQVQSAKNTVLYAVVGLVIALIAYAIVNFVISTLAGSDSNSGTGT